MDRRSGMRVTGVDACRGGWVTVSLEASPAPAVTVTSGACLAALLAPERHAAGATVVGIDMPLGLLETGWRPPGTGVRRNGRSAAGGEQAHRRRA